MSEIAPATVSPFPSYKISWRRRASAWLWGYDYFISYHWASGGVYAVALAERLRDLGYDVFLDRDEYAFGDDWKEVGERALRNTQRLVLVATREAVTLSQPVEHEVRVFTARGRQVIPIVFSEGSVEEKRRTIDGLNPAEYVVLALMPDSKLYIEDDLANLPQGPKKEVVERLTHTYQVMRGRDIRAMLFGVLALILIGLAAFATVSWGNSEVRRWEAESEREKAEIAARKEKVARDEAVRREREARHEQGVGWLARSVAAERRRDYLAAKLMAMKSIGYAGFRSGLTGESEELLLPTSNEYKEAVRRIVAFPEANLLYVAKFDARDDLKGLQCAFNERGTQVTAISSGARVLTLDFQKGTAHQVEHPTDELQQVTAALRFPRALVGPGQFGRGVPLSFSNGHTIRVDLGFYEVRWGNQLAKSNDVEIKLPKEFLRKEENDGAPELTDLTVAREAPVLLATITNSYVQSVVAIPRRGGPKIVAQYTGEISGWSGVAQCAGACVSDDGNAVVVSETNGITDSANRLQVYRKAADGSYSLASTVVVDGGTVKQLTLSHNKQYLAGAVDKTIFIWNLSQSRLVATLTGHSAPVASIDFSPDQRAIASVSNDGFFMIRELPFPSYEWLGVKNLPLPLRPAIVGHLSATEPSRRQQGFGDPITCPSLSHDLMATWSSFVSDFGIASGERYGTMEVVDTGTSQKVLEFTSKLERLNEYHSMRFADNRQGLFLEGENDEKALVTVYRPRRGTDYMRAYSFVRYTNVGIEFSLEIPPNNLQRVTLPRRLSSIRFAETVSVELLNDAIDWYYQKRGVQQRPATK